jgi:hypothetical protein
MSKPAIIGDELRRLRDDLGVECPSTQITFWSFAFCSSSRISRPWPELGEHLVVDRVDQHHAVVRRAGGGEVERLGDADLLGGVVEVGGLVDGDHRIAGADAERRRAARISGLHHRRAAGGEDAVALAHQLVGLLDRRRVDAHHEVGRRAHLDDRRAHQVADQLVGQLGARVRRDDDRIAALDREIALITGVASGLVEATARRSRRPAWRS